MSERGSFTTNYIYNEHDYQSVKNALDINDKYICVAPPASWSNGCETFEMPIVQGKVGGSIPGGEYLTIIDNLQGIQTVTTIIIIVVQDNGDIIRLDKHPFGNIDTWMLKPVKEKEKMKLIDADAFLSNYKGNILTAQTDYAQGARDIMDDIRNAPTIDAVPVVRCKDCTYCSHFTDGHLECRLLYNLKPVATTYCQMEENDFCSYGVRKGEQTM